MDKEAFNILYEDFVPLWDKDIMWKVIESIKDNNPKHVLEIGLEYGGSSRIWGQFCEENKGRYVGIDLNPMRARCMLTEGCSFPSHFIKGDALNEDVNYFVSRLAEENGTNGFDLIIIDTGNEETNDRLASLYEKFRNNKGKILVKNGDTVDILGE